MTRNSFKNFTELVILGREWEAEMEKSRLKGQQIKIIDKNQEQQHSQDYENNYERQNNFRHELQNTQYRPQF